MYMVSLGQNELIGVCASVLQGIHHNIIVFCNISWIRTEYENKIKPADKKIACFHPNWVFPDCNSSLN